jgi:hypothetical protein
MVMQKGLNMRYFIGTTSIVISLLSTFAFATADGPDYWRTKNVASNDVLWIHPTPDPNSERIGQIPPTAVCIQNLGCQGNISFEEYQLLTPKEQELLKRRSRWCKISYQTITGWVNGRFLQESSHSCSVDTGSSNSSPIRFTKQMLQGKVLQTQESGSTLTLTFLPSTLKSFDGEIRFHFSNNNANDDERLNYKLQNGQIIYYSYDGAKYRLTLLNATPETWTIFEEEDIDGDGDKFTFKPGEKSLYAIRNN